MTNLILVRHGQSEWNALNQFTGWKDVELTEQGREEARHGAAVIKAENLTIDQAFTSDLKRAQDTLTIILAELGLENLDVHKSQKLNERDYGDLTGKNKDQARQEFGEEQVHIWRRSYDVPPPGGESLKETEQRTWPYFESTIMPLLKGGKTILIAAHGNSLRAIVKRLENLTPEEILKVEIATGAPIFYTLDHTGQVTAKHMGQTA